MGQRLANWMLLGAIGYCIFFVLLPSIDFNAGDPIQENRSTIESKTAELAIELGFSTDSLNLLTTRSQHLSYYKTLRDSLGEDMPSLGPMNDRGLFLNSWQVSVGGELQDQEGAFSFSQSDLYNRVGRLQLRYDDAGKVRRADTNPNNYNPTFIAGDSLLGVAQKMVTDVFAYDLSGYRLSSIDIQDTSITTTEPGFDNQSLDFQKIIRPLS